MEDLIDENVLQQFFVDVEGALETKIADINNLKFYIDEDVCQNEVELCRGVEALAAGYMI